MSQGFLGHLISNFFADKNSPCIPVSIILPAYNAAFTLEQTVASVQAQTVSGWEVIIVDDGSEDNTPALAAQFAAQDERVRTVSQPNQGVSAARNTGIAIARYDWLLFLDADDTLAVNYLEKMTAPLNLIPDLDVVVCRVEKVTSDGVLIYEVTYKGLSSLFAESTQRCPFNLIACIARKQLIQSVGCFDVDLKNCNDWDLLQRLARSGAQFQAVDEVLGYYRKYPGSLSSRTRSNLIDGLRVIERGHMPDPRVPNPHPDYSQGAPPDQLAAAKLHWLAWIAGLALGVGENPCSLLDLVCERYAPDICPTVVAYGLFYGVPSLAGQSLTAWTQLWPSLAAKVSVFLNALEVQAQAEGFAKRSQIVLEDLVRSHWQGSLPAQIGTLYVTQLELSVSLADLMFESQVERLYADITLEEEPIGALELPIEGNVLPSTALADAIVTESLAWCVLGRFFCATIYSQRGIDQPQYHDQEGWLIFLQELWGLPDASLDGFYDSNSVEFAALEPDIVIFQAAHQPFTVEVSETLPTIVVVKPADKDTLLEVIPTVAGMALASVKVPVVDGIVTPQALRATVTQASGFELCRVCVREGLLGQSIEAFDSLRSRLAERGRFKSSAALV